MGFYISQDEITKTLNTCIKFNNGFYRSEKQAKLFTSQVMSIQDNIGVLKNSLEQDNIPANATHYFISSFIVSWADYGRKSKINVRTIYFLDNQGVIQQKKLGFVGNERDGYEYDTLREVVKFERGDAKCEWEFAPVIIPETTGIHIGNVGERVTLEGTIISVTDVQRSIAYHYYDSMQGHKTLIDVDGATVIYWNLFTEKDGDEYITAEAGDKVKFTAKIKSHGEYKNIRQTTVSRATKVAIEKKEETTV